MRAFNDLKLLTKITIPLVLLIAVTVGIVGLAGMSLKKLADTTQQIVDVTAARMDVALKLQAASRLVAIDEKNIILETEKEKIAAQKEQYVADKAAAIEAADKLISLANTDERRAKTGRIKQLLLEYFSVLDRSVALGATNQNAAAIAISVTEGGAARAKVVDVIAERVSSYERDLATAKQDAADLAQRTIGTLIVVAAIGLSAAAALTFGIIIFMVGRPLTGMVDVTRRLAEGDLDIHVAGAERKDEIGLLAAALRVFK
ncbi:MAG: HAMP domain-containing protein, partial [Rhodospirillales bacterium]|nr:HAMP domain-containing protein [Rhodospirillales bacterium]